MVRAHRRLWAVLITICTILGIVFFAAGLGLAVLAGKGSAINSGSDPKGSLAIVRKVAATDIKLNDVILVPDITVDAWDAAKVVSVTPTGNNKAIYTVIPAGGQVSVPGNYLSRWTDMVLWSTSGLGALAPLLNSPVLIGVGMVLLAGSIWGIYRLRRLGRAARPAKVAASPAPAAEQPEPAPVEAPLAMAAFQPVVDDDAVTVVPEPLALPIGTQDTTHELAQYAPAPAIPSNSVNRRTDRWVPEGYLTGDDRAERGEVQPPIPVALTEPSRPASSMPTEVPDEMWDEVWSDAVAAGSPEPAAPVYQPVEDELVLPQTLAPADQPEPGAAWPSPLAPAESWHMPDEIFDPQVAWGTGELPVVDPHVTWTGPGSGIQAEEYPWPPEEAGAPTPAAQFEWPSVPLGPWQEADAAAPAAAWVSEPAQDTTAIDSSPYGVGEPAQPQPVTSYTWTPTEESLLSAEPEPVQVAPQRPFGHTVCEHVGIAWPIKAGLRAAGLTGAPATRVVPLHAPAPVVRPQESQPMFQPYHGTHASVGPAVPAGQHRALEDMEVLPSRRSLRERVA